MLVHLLLFFRDATFDAKRCEAYLERLIFDDLAIGPAGTLQVEDVAIKAVIELVVALADKDALN